MHTRNALILHHLDNLDRIAMDTHVTDAQIIVGHAVPVIHNPAGWAQLAQAALLTVLPNTIVFVYCFGVVMSTDMLIVTERLEVIIRLLLGLQRIVGRTVPVL
uniref:Uncharacterized protein n=1 Tax=Anopheles culicifacies TaxID=139723 RepID=A0A182LUX5_9DIPT